MKRILILCLTIGSFFSGLAQTPWGVKNYNFYPFNGIRVDKVIKLPDTSYALAEDGSIAFQNHAFWLKDTIWKLIIAPDDINVAWGTIIGDPNDQSDLMALINAKANKSTTLTINGVAQTLGADRSWGPFLVPADTTWIHNTLVSLQSTTDNTTFSQGLLKTGNSVVALKNDAVWNAEKIQGFAVATTSPTSGQVLAFSTTNNRYEPTNASGIVSTPTLQQVIDQGHVLNKNVLIVNPTHYIDLYSGDSTNAGVSSELFMTQVGGISLESRTVANNYRLLSMDNRSITMTVTPGYSTASPSQMIMDTAGTMFYRNFRLQAYGAGFKTGTATYNAAFDASGNLIEVAAGGGSAPGIDDVLSVGQTFTADRTIDASSHSLTLTGSGSTSALVTASGSNTALYTQSGSGFALKTFSNGAVAQFQTRQSSDNIVVQILQVQRRTFGTPSSGIGGSIDFYTDATGPVTEISNQLISKFTDATDATRTSQLVFTGVNSATTVDLLKLGGEGYAQLTGITATSASAITASAGMIVFVNSTNGTFTSVGFWGYDGSAWSKF